MNRLKLYLPFSSLKLMYDSLILSIHNLEYVSGALEVLE